MCQKALPSNFVGSHSFLSMNGISSVDALNTYIGFLILSTEGKDKTSSLCLPSVNECVNPLPYHLDCCTRFQFVIQWMADCLDSGSNLILFLHHVESVIHKDGYLFSSDISDCCQEVNTADYSMVILLLLYEYCASISQQLCCIGIMKEFCNRGNHLRLHSKCISTVTSFFLTMIKTTSPCPNFCSLACEWLSSVLELTDSPSTPLVHDFFKDCIGSQDCKPLWKSLDSIIQSVYVSSTFFTILVNDLFFPLISNPLSIKALSYCPFILNWVRLLVQKASPTISKEVFPLWSECLLHCTVALSAVSSDEVENVLSFILFSIQNYSLSIQFLCRSLQIATQLLQLIHSQSMTPSPFILDSVISVVCPLFLQPHYRLNKTLINRGLSLFSLLSKFTLSKESILTLTQILLYIDSSLIQHDIENDHPYKPAGSRHDYMNCICCLDPPIQMIVEWLLLPLSPFRALWLQQVDLVQIINRSLMSSPNLVFSNDFLVHQILWTILSSFPNTTTHLDKASQQFLMICSSQTENTFKTLLTSRLSSEQLSFLCQQLISQKKSSLVLPFITQLLITDHSYTITGEPSPVLQVLSLLPFTTLQEELIEQSSSIQTDRDLVMVLKLLYTVNMVFFREHHLNAVEQTDKEQLDEKMRTTRIMEIERALNVLFVLLVKI